MSRVISAVILLLFLISVCSFALLMTEHFTDDLRSEFDAISGGKSGQITVIQEKWSKYSEYASVYLDHEELEQLSQIIASLPEANAISREYLKMNCVQAKEMLMHIRESERATLSNIF